MTKPDPDSIPLLDDIIDENNDVVRIDDSHDFPETDDVADLFTEPGSGSDNVLETDGHVENEADSRADDDAGNMHADQVETSSGDDGDSARADAGPADQSPLYVPDILPEPVALDTDVDTGTDPVPATDADASSADATSTILEPEESPVINDAITPHSGIPNSSIPDSSIPDSSNPDSSIPDSSTFDQGASEPGNSESSIADSDIADALIDDAGISYDGISEPAIIEGGSDDQDAAAPVVTGTAFDDKLDVSMSSAPGSEADTEAATVVDAEPPSNALAVNKLTDEIVARLVPELEQRIRDIVQQVLEEQTDNKKH